MRLSRIVMSTSINKDNTFRSIEESGLTCFNERMIALTPSQKERITDTLVVLIGTFPIFRPLIEPRFFWSHENAYFLWRVASVHHNVLDGAPFCRWFPDFARGFGLPFLEFYPVLPVTIGELFRLTGISTITSVKLTIGVITLFAAGGAYRLGRTAWGRWGGIITSILFSYAPYKLVNLYVRGDINEYLAMAALPWALWIVLTRVQQADSRWISFPTIIIMMIISVTHYPSCVIQYPFIILWIICLSFSAPRPVRFFFQHALSVAIALVLSSTFWLSAFLSRHLVQMEGMTQGFADYRNHFIEMPQWFSMYWNFGASVKGPGDAISFQLGNLSILLILVSIPLIPGIFRWVRVQKWTIIAACSGIGISLFLMHAISHPVWKVIPLLPMLQFPYRILVIPAVLLPFLAGMSGQWINRIPRRWQFPTVTGITVLVIAASVSMCRVAAFMNLTEDDLDRESIRLAAHTHCTGEYIPKPVGNRFPPPKPVSFTLQKIPETGFSREQTEARLNTWLETASGVETWEGGVIRLGNATTRPGGIDVLAGKMTLSAEGGSPVNRWFTVESQTPGILRVNQFFFEGWTARIDQTAVVAEPDLHTGLICIDIPPGTHRVELRYHNLPIAQKLLKISWIVLILLICFYVIEKRKSRFHA
ncbi:hypothetical protein JXA80_05035 [bacterium]|nr:hypothetical protein [candidate division CSSED10-310 bacterium]